MLLVKEYPMWCSNCNGEYIFPGLRLNKRFPWKFGINFFKQMDRYGREHVFLKFPLDGKLNKNEVVPNANYSTILIWSVNLTFVDTITCGIYSAKDNRNDLGYLYTLISARKGTRVRVRDKMEEVELVF
jgi:formate-dependent nitrite reductase cytochrome c552 subunit